MTPAHIEKNMTNKFEIVVCDWTELEAESKYAVALNHIVVFQGDELLTCQIMANLMMRSYNNGLDDAVDALRNSQRELKQNFKSMSHRIDVLKVTKEMQDTSQ